MSSINNTGVEGHDFPEADGVPPIAQAHERHRRRRSRGPLRKVYKRLRRYIKLRMIGIGTVVVLIVSALTLSIMITDATSQLTGAWQSLNRVLNSITSSTGTELTLNDFNRLESSLSELQHKLNSTRSRVGYVAPLAELNPDWRVTLNALDVAQQLAAAADEMLSGLQPAMDFMVQGEEEEAVATRISSGERIVELLQLGRGSFIAAQNYLRLAEAQIHDIDLSAVSPDLLLQVEQLRDYRQELVNINSVLLISPDLLTTLLGLDEERSYLVLAQNNDEIRPSGGYISTYGWFTVRGGRITNFDYSPTTASSPNPPNEDFLETFEVPSWWIRYQQPIYAAWDGSWYADFPSTAELAMSYYNAGGNPQSPVDGVIAIDISGFELMLSALGEVYVAEYDKLVTPENFRQVVYDIRAFGQGVTPHKQFVAAVYRAIFAEWRSIDQERTPDLMGALLQGVQQHHIMIYFATSEANEAVSLLGWSGKQEAGTGHDYVMVADANLGNKSNNSVDRTMTYDVEILPDGTLSSRLSVRYDYFAQVAENDPAVNPEYHGPIDYRNLMQVFLPVGAQITETNNVAALTTADDPNHTLLVTRTLVAYDSGERYQFFYTTPPLVEFVGEYERYRLLIQKQPGSRTQAVNVQITLPADAKVITSAPAADASYSLEQPILDFRLSLDTDQWIEVVYQSSQTGN